MNPLDAIVGAGVGGGVGATVLVGARVRTGSAKEGAEPPPRSGPSTAKSTTPAAAAPAMTLRGDPCR